MIQQRHLLHVFSTFAPGGPQVRTVRLMEGLGKKYRHTVVAMDCNYQCAGRLSSSVQVEYRDPPKLSAALTTPWVLSRFLREINPHLLLTYNWGAIESIPGARLAGLRHVVHAEDGFGPEEVVRLKLRRVLLRRLFFPLVRQVVVPSRFLEDILKNVWRVPGDKQCYIPNGIDTEHFSPGNRSAARQQLGLEDNDFLVGTVATFRKEKSLDFLIRAVSEARQHCPIKLLLVGEGPEEEKLRHLVKERNLQDYVIFPGHVVDPVHFYQAMDLFALSSTTEQMPISVVEAMSCATPILSTDVGDVRSMVSAENQPWIQQGRDELKYGKFLVELLHNPSLRNDLGQANRQKCLDEFQEKTMLDAYDKIYVENSSI
ncbi:MAG: glycosyltransferase [Methylococcaceae bacterium]